MTDKVDIKKHFLFLFMAWTFLTVSCSPSSVSTPAPPSPTLPGTTLPTREVETPTPTPDFYTTAYLATSTAIVEAIVAAEEPRVHGVYPSPDGKWQAEVIIYDCVKVDARLSADANAYEQLKLIQVSGGDEKIVDNQLQYCGGLGAAGLDGLFWSLNSLFFYYTNAREGVPDGCGFWERPTLRLDINTLKIEYLGGGPVSPDGNKMATWQGIDLVVSDVNKGTEVGRISPYILNTETGTGYISWSPDSQALVYVQPETYCPVSGNSYTVRVDLPNLEQTFLLESESPTFGSVSWDTASELRLFDENGKEWIYDFGNEELKPLP